MKLKPEYIRTIMLTLEKELTVNSDLSFKDLCVSDISKFLPKIPREDVFYTLCKLEEAGYICFSVEYSGGRPINDFVSFITYDGHVFLDTIRNDNVWSKTLKALSSIGATAPALIKDIAAKYLMIQLGL